MKFVFAMFGAFTALNTLVTAVLLWIGFAYDKPNLITTSREFFLEVNKATYIYLTLGLTIELLIWGYKKWKNRA